MLGGRGQKYHKRKNKLCIIAVKYQCIKLTCFTFLRGGGERGEVPPKGIFSSC